MALETVVDYSQDPFSYYSFKDFYSLLGGSSNFLGYNDDQEFDQEDKPSLVGTTMDGHANNWEDFNNMTTTTPSDHHHHHHHHHRQLGGVDYNTPNHSSPEPGPAAIGRRKRRRARSGKNKEEIETQRMTHIAVERNRRRQMNEYLAVLRSLMPPSYVHRGDQASIVGGAINFVKELEQLLQSMEGHNHKRCHGHDHGHDHDQNPSNDKAGRHGLAEFFTFPQYSTRGNSTSTSAVPAVLQASESQSQNKSNDDHWAVADIEVTMVDSHANLKILAKKRPRLLLRLATGLQALGLGILHLNVTTADQMVLYSVSVKVEEGCQLNTVDEIASAVNQMLRRIQDEPAFN